MNSHGKVFLFAFSSGVLQGWPKSATLFLFAINPFLLHFEEALKGNNYAEVRACADDIGICFRDFRGLKVAHLVFACAQSFSGMNLKPKKCNIVPLNFPDSAHFALDLADARAQDVAGARADGSDEKLGSQICAAPDPFVGNVEKVREYIHGWLMQNIPDWQNFKITSHAKYLGFFMGPKAGSTLWNAPISKWLMRTKDYANAHMNASLAAITYNSRAISVLGYIGQLFPPPSMQARERAALHHSIHLPTNAWDRQMFSHLSDIGGTNFSCTEDYCRTAMIRTACKTIKWSTLHNELVSQAEKHLAIRSFCCGELNNKWWDTEPCVLHLYHSFHGLGPFSRYKQASDLARVAQHDPKNKESIQAIAFHSLQLLSLNKETRYWLLFRRTRPLGFSQQYILSRSDVDRAFGFAKASAYHDAIAWLKTVTNGWCTSERMHEVVKLPCIFGCNAALDNLKHYLECRILWSLIDEAFCGLIHPLPIGRVNYLDPNTDNVILISAAFEIYHALKIGLREVVLSAIQSMRFGDVCRISRKLILEKLRESRGRLVVLPRSTNLSSLCSNCRTPEHACPIPVFCDPDMFSSSGAVFQASEADSDNAQGSWPSFGLQARCG